MRDLDESPSERAETDTAADADATTVLGIRRLRERRGDERVAYAEVADRLADYVEHHPHDRELIDHVASFLAGVEPVPHGEDGGDASTSPSSRSSD